LGSNHRTMTDYSASQGETPVNAAAPNLGAGDADPSIAVRQRISADSFRRLMSKLNKPAIPSLDILVSPETIIPELKVEPIVQVALAPQILVAEPTDNAETPIELIQTEALQTVEETIEVPVVIKQTEILALPEELQIVEESVEVPAIVEEAVILALPEEPAEVAEPVKKPTPRQKPRDAFAVSPGTLPQRPPAPVIQQTPEQEQEAAELARSLLDMMAAGNSAGLPQERALAADTLLRMLPRLPLKSTIMLAERVRLMDAPPPMLMAKLIADPNIAVAGPILEDSNHIGDEDLSMVINDNDYAKIRLIARRRKLSRAITSELIKTGDDSVLLTLVRNLGAEITQESFLALSEHAKDYPELLAPLCTRPDLPVPFAFELFWLAPVQLRRYLLNRFLTDSENLTKILKITRVTDGDEPESPLALDIEKVSGAFDLLSAGETEAAAFALSAMANINTATTERILADTQGEPMAALLKVIGVSRGDIAEAFEILQTTSPALIDPERNVEELQSTFDSLSFNKARILLTYWDWATLKTGPYAPFN
jgi:Uncharacterised protein conserved in bacteria (DUF2336)